MIEHHIPYESATGVTLAMREFLPDSELRPRAGLVLVHGLGDYIMRHSTTVEALTSMGIAIIGIAWPGHGESEGKRGKVGCLADVHTVIDEARAALREIVEPIGGKIGAIGHSAGGLLLFDYLTRYPGNLAFAWINSCLIDPLHRRGGKTATFAKLANLVAPSLTISTKIVSSMGKVGEPDEIPPRSESKGHDRVSVRFGLELLKAQQRIEEFHSNLNRDFCLLMTHGGKDEVCPIQLARDFYSKLGIRNKEFREFPEHLHHLLDDPRVIELGSEWLRRVLSPPAMARRG